MPASAGGCKLLLTLGYLLDSYLRPREDSAMPIALSCPCGRALNIKDEIAEPIFVEGLMGRVAQERLPVHAFGVDVEFALEGAVGIAVPGEVDLVDLAAASP